MRRWFSILCLLTVSLFALFALSPVPSGIGEPIAVIQSIDSDTGGSLYAALNDAEELNSNILDTLYTIQSIDNTSSYTDYVDMRTGVGRYILISAEQAERSYASWARALSNVASFSPISLKLPRSAPG